MSGIVTKIVADLRRRGLQTAVIFVIILLASGVTTLALTLLSQSSGPYDRAFTAQRGAHLLSLFYASAGTPAQLQATTRQSAATASGGPWPAAPLKFQPTSLPPTLAGLAHGLRLPQSELRLVGRDNPGGAIDRLQIVAGRWVQRPDEIVLTRSFAEKLAAQAGGGANTSLLGARLRVLNAQHNATFVVVGEVIDVNEADSWLPQQAWVQPGVLTSLAPARSLVYEMAYRFGQADADSPVQSQMAAIKAALPPGALYRSYPSQQVKTDVTTTTSLVLTFLLAFSVFALIAVALIVTNVVTGVVLASYREIGIMKAIGFTPGQVMEVLVGQILIPTLAGCLVGIPVGALLSGPLLNQSAQAMGLPAPAGFVPALDLLAFLAVVLVVSAAAIVPAWRGSRLSPVRVLASGTAPSSARGSWLGRRLQGLGLPRPLSLGAGDAFVRPLRGSLTAVAVLIGVATIVFAVGLRGTLQHYNQDPTLHSNDYVGGSYQVEVNPNGSMADAQVMRLLLAQPGTATVVAYADAFVNVPGVTDPVQAIAVRGDATAQGYHALDGRWFSGQGEAVAGGAFINEAHLRLGDRFTISLADRSTGLRLVGTDFDLTSRGRVMRLPWASYLQINPGGAPFHYAVQLRPGTDPVAYAHHIQQTAPASIDVIINNPSGSTLIDLLTGVVAVLALVLALIAVAGVFNTMLLNTRERLCDLAVVRAVGMSPHQVMGMVTASAGTLGVVGGVLGLPAGLLLYGTIGPMMANQTGNTIPLDTASVFSPWVLLLLILAGIVVALIGAWLPARWAARAPVVEMLHAE
jgi:putative ABC transport system permease protein